MAIERYREVEMYDVPPHHPVLNYRDDGGKIDQKRANEK
jgi:hypothetical protein